MKTKFIKEIKILAMAVVTGSILALAVSTQLYAESVQTEISQNVIRLHVMPNSNSDYDQALKKHVRDGVLDRFGSLMNPYDLEESREFLKENLDEIEIFAGRLVHHEGYDYPVLAFMDRVFFPTRDYGNISFPAGYYEAVRIIIGTGRGNNWWCVMFPPLCYVDVTAPNQDNSTLLSNRLSPETYALMNHVEGGTSVTVRFKIVEWWQELMHSNNGTEPPITVLMHDER